MWLWIMTLNSPGGSTLQCGTSLWDDVPLNSPKRPPYWNSTSGFDSTISPQSTCTAHGRKLISCRFSSWRISAILDFRGRIMGSSKSPCTTSYRSSIETIALNCLFFLRKSHFCILATEGLTDTRTNRWTGASD